MHSTTNVWNLWSKVEGILDKDHLLEITNVAISYMKKHPGKTELEKIVGKIKINGGFRPLIMDQKKLVRELVSRMEKDKTMRFMLPFIETWAIVETNLYQEVMSNIPGKPVKMAESSEHNETDEASVISEEISNLASSLLLSRDYKKQDIKLMICYILASKIEKSDEGKIIDDHPEDLIAASVTSDNGNIWDDCLAQFENLPADAEEWAYLDEFVDKLHKIAGEKQHLREQQVAHKKLIATFIENFDKMSVNYSYEIDFFDISFVNLDQIEELTSSEILQLEESIVALQLYFDTYRELKQKPVNKVAEEQRKFSEIGAISQKIIELAATINCSL